MNSLQSPERRIYARPPRFFGPATSIGVHLTPERWRVLRLTVLAVLGTRILVWEASILASRIFGLAHFPSAYNPADLEPAHRSLGALLTFPIIRWDGDWYLSIAAHGYALTGGLSPPPRANFFPLYPLLVAGLHRTGIPLVVAAATVSIGAFTVALYLFARLAQLELRIGAQHTTRHDAVTLAVVSLAISPFSFFFSSAYAESVYLALSLGVFLCARRGRWWLAGALAGLASAARGPGLLLVVPLLVLYLYGPRTDRPPDRAARRWRPTYLVRPDFASVLLAPAGLVAYAAYLGAAGGDPVAFLRTQHLYWHHVLAFPWTSVWESARNAWLELHAVLAGKLHMTLFGVYPGASVNTGWEHLLTFTALIVAVPAVVGVWRTLPRAYGIYVALSVTAILISPVTFSEVPGVPRYLKIATLPGSSRYLSVLFPLFMWFGTYLSNRPRTQRPVLVVSGLLLAWLSAEFATWHLVA
jgi:Mannosyltransferase (PIG-V)